MKYAIIRTGGKQYKVSEGEILEIEKPETEKKLVEFKEVLLLVDEEGVRIGQPLVEKVKVVGEILEQTKKKKIRVAKFRAKTGYRKVTGHRQKATKIKIKKISLV